MKRAVDRDARPGRFLLTGSVRADLEAATWPGTGRVVRVPMYGMTVRELSGAEGRPLLDQLAAGEWGSPQLRLRRPSRLRPGGSQLGQQLGERG